MESKLSPSIAEDIQTLVNYWLYYGIEDEEKSEMTKAAERVEAYLSTFKPDHL